MKIYSWKIRDVFLDVPERVNYKNSKRSIFEDISLLQFVKLKVRISISYWVKFEKKVYFKN